MEAFTRPALALTAASAVALGSAMTFAPPMVQGAPASLPASLTVSAQNVVLAGFIADFYNEIQPAVAQVVGDVSALIGNVPLVGPPIENQIDILYTYGQQLVGGTVYWVDDLVTPLLNGNFWPLSGDPGNYLINAANSTIDWGEGLVDTAVGFVQAEINYLFGWIPNIPNIINEVVNTIDNIIGWINIPNIPNIVNSIVNAIDDVIGWLNIPNIVNAVANSVENVINWITGWIPGPLAAVEAGAAGAMAPVVRGAVLDRPVAAVTAAPEDAAGTAPVPGADAAPEAVQPGSAPPVEATPAEDVKPAPEDGPARSAEVDEALPSSPVADVSDDRGESVPPAVETRRSTRAGTATESAGAEAGVAQQSRAKERRSAPSRAVSRASR